MKQSKNIAKLFVLSAGMLTAVSCGANSSSSATTSASTQQSSTQSTIHTGVTNKFTVAFNSCGGTAVRDRIIDDGMAIGAMPESEREGYSLLGWSTSYSNSKKMGVEADMIEYPYTIRQNTFLYAVWQKAEAGHHTQEEIDAYVEGLKDSSEANHLYFHYYRFDNNAAVPTYDKWDLWAWPYRPTEGEGTLINWKGQTNNSDFRNVVNTANISVTGTPYKDDFGGTVADIDLTKDYYGGTSNKGKSIGGTKVDFYEYEIDKSSGARVKTNRLNTQVGIQIVKSSSRPNPEGEFWTNDGGDLHVDLTDPEKVMTVDLGEGKKAWHVFALQDKAADFGAKVITDLSDPFETDDGTTTTRGNPEFDDVKWNITADKQKTSSSFKGGVGVGYQIQVASFADSDGDGFGDIYGITSKLDYLQKLGVKALWLTPVQKSDSYHGYDISDYEAVDEKFGSKTSTAGKANGGKVTPATAMADYLELIDKAHAKGMKIVMDLVLNHTSTSNKWFIKSAQLDDEYRGYYQWGTKEAEPSVITEKKCWFPYGDTRYVAGDLTKPYTYCYYAKFGSSMPELNYQYQATRDAVNQMSVNWVKKGVDGFRLDAVKHIFMRDEVKTSQGDVIIEDIAAKGDYSSNLTKNLHFYRELNKAVKAENKDAFFVGENFDGSAFQVSPFYEAFDSMFDFWGYFNITTAASRAIGHYTGAGRTLKTVLTGPADPYNAGGNSYFNGKSYQWYLPSILQSYDDFRGDKALPGFFTSNHDIARVINRIHSSAGDSNGISEQGNVTTSDYTKFRKAADLTKAIEILMPGCTWIYYGDEIGMTGNFPEKDREDKPYTSKSDYADLWWRQPMKWAQGGKVGDGSMTTGFAITGSAASIKWDDINSTSTVADATSQANDNNSEFNKLAKIINFKNNNPALITGTVSDNGSNEQVMKFKNGGYNIEVNFTTSTVTISGAGSLSVTF